MVLHFGYFFAILHALLSTVSVVPKNGGDVSLDLSCVRDLFGSHMPPTRVAFRQSLYRCRYFFSFLACHDIKASPDFHLVVTSKPICLEAEIIASAYYLVCALFLASHRFRNATKFTVTAGNTWGPTNYVLRFVVLITIYVFVTLSFVKYVTLGSDEARLRILPGKL